MTKTSSTETEDEQETSSLLLPMIYVVLILLGIAGIVFLIPKVTAQENKKAYARVLVLCKRGAVQ